MFKAILRLTKQSVIYGIGHVLTKAVIIILLSVHTNFVTPHEYGFFAILMVFLGIMGIIYSFGLNTAFLQFYLLENEEHKRNKYFSTAFIATAITALILSSVLFVFKSFITRILFDSDQYDYLIKLSIGILSCDALILLAKNILRAEERSVSFVIFNLINVCTNCLLNIVFVVRYSMGVKGIFWAYFLSSVITLLLLSPITIKHFFPFISWQMLKKMLKFGLPFLPSTLTIFFMDSIDRIFIKRYLGFDATGIYGAGYRLALVIKLFINAFQIAWVPFFLSIARDVNTKAVFSKILTYFTLMCSLIFLLFTMYMDQVVRFSIFGYTIIGERYWGSTQIVPIVMLGYICYGLYLNFLVGVYLKEKTKYLVFITGSGAVINILGNFLLIPSFKLMGAAYATLLSYLCMAIFLYFAAQRYYPIKYEFRKILKIGLLSMIIFLIFKYVPLPYPSVSKMLLMVIYFALLYFSGFFESKEIQSFKTLIKGFHGKISAR